MSAPRSRGSRTRRSFFDHCALADYDPARPQALVDGARRRPLLARTGSTPRARDAVLALIRETTPDAVLNAVDPVFNVPIFDACFEAGVTYLDMAMTLSEPHPERPFELHGRQARRLPVRAGRGVGGEGPPRARRDRHRAGRGRRLRASRRRRAVLGDRRGRRSATARTSSSRATTSRRPSRSGRRSRSASTRRSIWERDRGWFTTAPFSEPEVFDFPEGIGPVECVNVEHEEVLLVPRWIDCQRVTFKYGLGDEFIEVLRTLAQARARQQGADPRQGRRGRAARRRRGCAPRPGDARRPDDRQDVRGHARHRHGQATAARGRPTSTTSSTTSGRCASTARRRSSGRRRSTRSSRSSSSPAARGRAPACSGPRRSRRSRILDKLAEYGSPHGVLELEP